MRRTLFYVPHEFFDLNGLGFGWLLIGWIVFSICLIVWLIRQQGWNRDTRSYLPVLILVGIVFWLLLPMMELKAADESIVGLAIRGYGTMVMIGVIGGVSMACFRARRMGIDPEHILSLAFFVFIGGIIGARGFYVLQKSPQFFLFDQAGNFLLWESVKAIFNVTEGGLVVYGSLIGAGLAGVVFLWRKKLPVLAVADLIAPSLLVGLAIGRLGCVLNGCCFGGVCDAGSPFPSIQFPRDVSPTLHSMLPAELRENSPPYFHQRHAGLLHGIRIDAGEDSKPVVGYVDKAIVKNVLGSGDQLEVGDEIVAIGNGLGNLGDKEVASFAAARRAMGSTTRDLAIGSIVTVKTADGKHISWNIGKLPAYSKPVHPTQIYSAINAGLLAAFLWFYYPLRRRDGELFALLLIIYAVGRSLLELIRDDEGGQFGTALTISQWVSICGFVFGVILLICICRKPADKAL